MTWKKRSALGITFGLILLLGSGCARNSRSDFCLLYEPIFTSSQDLITEDTQVQIDDNNIVWDTICNEPSRG
jgi:hypothetical protein